MNSPLTEESDKETHSHHKLFTAVLEKSLRRQISLKESMSMGRTLQSYGLLTTLLFSTKNRNKWQIPKQSELRKSESWPRNTQRKTKYMANHADSEDILIKKKFKVTDFKYLGQNTHLKDTAKEEIYARIRAACVCFGKKKSRKYSKRDNSPFHSKKQVMDQCVLLTMTYGCQTWSLNKQLTNKLRTAQRAVEKKMLGLRLQDTIPCSEIRKRK